MVRRKKLNFRKVEAPQLLFFGKEARIEAGFTVAILVSILEVGLRSSIFSNIEFLLTSFDTGLDNDRPKTKELRRCSWDRRPIP